MLKNLRVQAVSKEGKSSIRGQKVNKLKGLWGRSAETSNG